ncbi:threonine--tRNA ligase [Vallitalea guaymasensis]|uniref:Threonine--tRNA ligase n=2 Tax=Vallitalea guaymasensis TaxID=1185412 RepID=A0A8J8SEY5_9FIRM|nr:threonine--tRNA ligase [Vallitalea guaymasensis]QUH32035.1 threonine--tRNA ligase [Vallitalea guaymasensis]
MMIITLKDGSKKEYESSMSVIDIANDISAGLARMACAGEVDGEVVDLRHVVDKDVTLNILTFNDDLGKDAFRHTTAHILSQAVKRLFPEIKLAIGPSIENGYYYDFDKETPFTNEDMEAIEKEMKKIVKENLKITRFELPRDEAIKLMEEKGEDYKVELIRDLDEDAIISFYEQGEFVDLCAGPHLMTTKPVKAFKLLSVAGAYWRGDEKNKMLSRIYGTAFTKKAELDEHVQKLEEAKKRDHNKLGRELEYFTTSDVVGQGLPLIMPKGAKVIQTLQRFVEDEEESRGYQFTKTPLMAKSDLYKISGHWDHYKDGMFVLGDEDKDEEVFALRPMTCPFQYMIYKAKQRSYRDLPVRYSETSTLFRNESSGEMHGLIRVRQFTLADAHIICTPEQVKQEFKDVVDLVKYMMTAIGIQDDVWYRFSKWDENKTDKYINDPEAWEYTQNMMRKILNEIGLDYHEADGEAAFYGPKLDVQFKNVHGKEDTLFTIQIDFALAERFQMTYVDKDNEKQHPYIIHRSSIGCYERTLAMLIEKYAGAMPTWIAPVQAKVLPISEKYQDYANEVVAGLKAKGVRVELDDRAEKIGYKIREGRMERVPYLLIVGQQEAEEKLVAVRSRVNGDEGGIPLDDFIARIKEEIDNKEIIVAEESK